MDSTNMTQPAPKIIITGHINADYDALAAMVAVKTLYPEAALIAPPYRERTDINYFIDGIPQMFNFQQPKECDLSQVKLLVIVDTRQRSRVSHISEVLELPNLEIHCYDHHPDSPDDVEAAYSLVKPYGSTTAIIAEIMQEKNIFPDPDEATMMGIGIYADTGSFTYSSTTAKDLQAAGWLLSCLMDLSVIANVMKTSLTSQQILILNRMIENATTHEVHGIKIILTEVVLDEFMDDFSVLAHQMLEMESSEVILVMAQMGDRVQVVARSIVPDKVDVSKICAAFGGGGHTYAAAASVKNKTMAEIKAEMHAMLFSTINEEITVGKKMTTPAKVVNDTNTLAEAEAIMLRYGLKAVPVVAEGSMRNVGFLEHQTAARAVSHGLGNQPVSEFMGRAHTVHPDSSLYPAMEIILGQRQRMVPVVNKDENVVGVLTRTDVMRILLDDSIRIPEGNPLASAQKEKNIKNLLRDRLSAESYKLLNFVGELADKMHVPVYAVGGFVRDLLIDKINILDIDFTVEGDGIAFANALAQALNGRVREHPKFQTALVIYNDTEGNEQRLDIATARLEYYEYPGALPTVELASIKMDLSRRDFTINALAVRLNSSHFGELVDPFGAQRDMKEKNIRVLHSLSFIEDPTRILRAIRFEKRFDFRIAAQTEKLIKNCLQLGMFQKLSGARIFNELRHIFNEKSPLLCLKRMEGFGIMALIHPLLKLTAHKEILMSETEAVLLWYKLLFLKETPDTWKVFMLGLCNNLKYKEMSDVLDRLMFSERARTDFLSMREATRVAGKKIIQWQKSSGGMGELYKILLPLPLDGILYLMVQNTEESIKKEISHFLSRLWHMTIEINGNDILNMGVTPGPCIGLVLKKVLEEKADGRVQTREEQLELAWKLLKKHFPSALPSAPDNVK